MLATGADEDPGPVEDGPAPPNGDNNSGNGPGRNDGEPGKGDGEPGSGDGEQTPPGRWQSKEGLPYAVGGVASAVHDGRLHVLGGGDYETVDLYKWHRVYDPQTDTWSALADIPDGNGWGARAETRDGKLYLAGGWPWGGKLFRMYDPATDSWVSLPSIPDHYQWGAASAVIGDSFYMVGSRRDGTVRRSMYRFDFISGQWVRCADIPYFGKNDQLAGAVVDGKMYVLGVDPDGANTLLHIYDTETDSWSAGTTLPGIHSGAAAVAFDSRIYLLGGSGEDSELTAVEAYDPATAEWSAVAEMPNPRSDIGARVIGDRIHLVGGFVDIVKATTTHDVFYPLR